MNKQIAVFSGGCFWGLEYWFRQLNGITNTTVGYTGGSVPNPTYEQVKTGTTGHYEAVMIEFDPEKISYEELVKFFFQIHNFTQADGQGPDIGPQYLSNIFYLNDQQYQTALNVIKILWRKGYNVTTGLIKFDKFWPAEPEHQQYYERLGKVPVSHVFRKINWDSDSLDFPAYSDFDPREINWF